MGFLPLWSLLVLLLEKNNVENNKKNFKGELEGAMGESEKASLAK